MSCHALPCKLNLGLGSRLEQRGSEDCAMQCLVTRARRLGQDAQTGWWSCTC